MKKFKLETKVMLGKRSLFSIINDNNHMVDIYTHLYIDQNSCQEYFRLNDINVDVMSSNDAPTFIIFVVTVVHTNINHLS